MIAIASDFAGFPLKENLKEFLNEQGLPFKDFGTYSEASCDYPHFAIPACRAVVSGECSQAVLICGSGVGMSLVANKIPGIRCVCCSEPYSAEMAQRHNDTNAIALGSRVIGSGMARMILGRWLQTPFEEGIHSKRVQMIKDLDR